MADIATLGIAVESSGARAAAGDLKGLAAAASSAEQASTRLSQAGNKSETAFIALQAAAKRAGVSVDEMRARQEAFNTATVRMAGASMSAQKALVTLSAQSKAVANDNDALDKSTSRTSSTLEKFATRFTRGLIAGAAITGVRELIRYLFNLNAQLAVTADTAQRVGVGGQQFQGLQTAAAFKGIGGSDFNAAMLAFNQQIDLAKNGLGDLQTLLRSNGKAVTDTATTFGIVADLVKSAGSDAQKFSILQQAGLPASREFVRLMEQGGSAIKSQADAASKVTDQQLEEAKRVDDAWRRGWTNFENWGKSAAVNIFQSLGQQTTQFFADTSREWETLKRYARDIAAGFSGSDFISGNGVPRGLVTRGDDLAAPKAVSNKPTFDPALAKQQIALEQQRLSLLSPLATAQDTVRLKQLEINAAGLSNVGISRAQAEALKLIALSQFENARVQQQAAIGVFDFAKAQQAANDNLKVLVAQKLLDPNNPAQYAAATTQAAKSLEQLRDQANVAAAPLEGLQRLANESGNVRTQLDQFATTSANAITPALVDMFNGTTSLSNGFRNLGLVIVKAAEEAVVKLLILKPIIDSVQSSFGGSGLLGLGGLGGGTVGNGGIVLGGAAGPGLFAAADGGTFGPGWGVVGERGPELIKVNQGSVSVIPNHISKTYLPGFAEGGSLSASGGVTRGPWGQDNPQSNISFGDIHISVPEGTPPDNAAEIARHVNATMEQVAMRIIQRERRPRGALAG